MNMRDQVITRERSRLVFHYQESALMFQDIFILVVASGPYPSLKVIITFETMYHLLIPDPRRKITYMAFKTM